MSQYEIYTLCLCLIVFVALTALFTTLLVYAVKQYIRLVRHGAEDESLIAEYNKTKRKSCIGDIVDKVISCILCGVMLLMFGISLYINANAEQQTADIPTVRVVLSSSMSQKSEKNTYLFENGLNDQFDMFDLVVTERLPDEFSLELYDIVVYEAGDRLVIHRIVGIEEPNEKHPDSRRFFLRGDASEYSDRGYVTYDQMRGIYRGTHVPFLGSFVCFMQSPAGYLCLILVLFAVIATPIVEKKIANEKRLRLMAIGVISTGEEKEELPPVEILPEPIPVPDTRAISLQSKSFAFRFRLKKGDANMINCLFAAEKVSVQVNKSIAAFTPFSPFKYGKTPVAKLCMNGQLLETELDGVRSSPLYSPKAPKRISILFKQGGVPIAKLILKQKQMQVYLNLDHITRHDLSKLTPHISTEKSEQMFKIKMIWGYPDTEPLKKISLNIQRSGIVSIEEEL